MKQPISPQNPLFRGKDGQVIDVESKVNEVKEKLSGANVVIGEDAEATGMNSVAIGKKAKTQWWESVAIGAGAFAESNGNLAVGTYATAYYDETTAIGQEAVADANGSIVVGRYAYTNTENTFRLGAEGITSLQCAAPLTVTSDARDKTDIADIEKPLDLIKKLRPVTYVRNVRDKYANGKRERGKGILPYDREEHAKGTKKGSRRIGGLLAQEVQEVMNELYGTDNYANVVYDDTHDIEGEKPESRLSLSYETLIPFLIGAVQEQQRQIEELQEKVKGAEIL